MCLGGTPFERSHESIRLAARSVRQRCSIPRGVGVLVRALGGGGRGQGRLLVVARLCSMPQKNKPVRHANFTYGISAAAEAGSSGVDLDNEHT